jgi:uncharacterized protein with von Willebrand factor type A (vWA) domain
VAEGIFTLNEGRAWITGGEACGDHPEWVQELLDYLKEFEATGERVMEEIEDLLKSPLWHMAERAIWHKYSLEASYQEKRNLVGLLTIELKRRTEGNKKQQAETKSGNELIRWIERAIGEGKLDEARRWLDSLSPAQYQNEYRKLSEQLAEAMVRHTRETLFRLEAA